MTYSEASEVSLESRSFLNPNMQELWHGGDYNPEQWPENVLEEDMGLMQDAMCQVATIGIFAWAALEPEEGHYEFDWLKRSVDRLANNDRWFIIATPSASPPPWLSKKHPDILRTGPDRVRRFHGNRVNYNLGSKVYREYTRDIAQKLVEAFGGHPRLLAWHLSNEYGGADYSPESIAQFREWLRRKFSGDLGALNHAYWTSFWGHTYRNWDEIEPPGEPYGETSINGLTLDWQRFVTDQTIDFMLNEAAPLREFSPDVPITTNLMGTYPGLDYRKLAKEIDFVSWDSYPAREGRLDESEPWIHAGMNHDIMRSLKRGKPFLLMECSPSSANWYDFMALKPPGTHRFEGMQAIAHGSDGVQYFQWRQSRGCQEQFHGAVVSHCGAHNTRIYNEVKELGQELAHIADICGTTVHPEVAIVYDWENRWALNDAQGPTRKRKKYQATCFQHYKSFWRLGIPVDFIGMDDEVEEYKLVVAPMAYSLRPGFIERMEGFVRQGGTLVSTYLTGWVDENCLTFEQGFLTPFRDLLGIWSEEMDALYPGDSRSAAWLPEGLDFLSENSVAAVSQSFTASDFCELIHAEAAQVLATYTEGFYAGRPALTVNSVGKGKGYYVASRNEQGFVDAFLSAVAHEAGVSRAAEFEPVEGVTAQRRIGNGSEYVFFLNTNLEPVTVVTAEWGKILLAGRDVTLRSRARVPVGGVR